MTWPLSTCQDRLLRHLKARGNETVVFTLNEISEFDETEFKYRGHATGVMTDFPTRLMDWAKGKDSVYRRPKLTLAQDVYSFDEDADLELVLIDETISDNSLVVI